MGSTKDPHGAHKREGIKGFLGAFLAFWPHFGPIRGCGGIVGPHVGPGGCPLPPDSSLDPKRLKIKDLGSQGVWGRGVSIRIRDTGYGYGNESRVFL